MSKNNNKRPSWYHPIARWKYDGAMTSYHEFVSRVLPSDESARYDIELPPSWRTQPLQWLLVGIGAKKLPEGSGAGFVQAPWADIYTRVYGVTPIQDMPRYRTIYRNQPDIQGAIEKMVDMAIGRGFYIKHSDKKVASYLTEVADYIDLYQNMLVLAHDMLVYGNAYAEIQWVDTVSQEEQTYDYYGAVLSTSEINALQKEGKEFKAEELKPSYVAQVVSGKPTKRCMGIKPLDPTYMRVRRDSWGNVYGFLQWITFPPVLLETDNMLHIKYRPKSWAYECFVPDTLVQANPSVKEISQIQLGDKVLMHTGKYGTVENIKTFSYDGPIYSIKTWKSNVPVVCTPEHPFLVSRLITEKWKHDLDRLGSYSSQSSLFAREKPQWICAKDIKKGDMLIVPVDNTVNDVKTLDISEYVKDVKVINRGFVKTNIIPTKIPVNEDFLRICGYYLAEGSQTPYIVSVSFAADEEYLVEDFVVRAKRLLGLNVGVYKHKNGKCYTVYVCSKMFGTLMERMFGKYSYGKFIPQWIMELPPEKQKWLLDAYIDGDGWRSKDSKNVSVGTVSKQLANQVYKLFLRQGLEPSLTLNTGHGGGAVPKGNYSGYTVFATYNKKLGYGKSWVLDSYYYVEVKSVTSEPYNGIVYNLDITDDETFTVGVGYAVHNSAYGTSMLMPLIKNNDLLEQLENDSAIWVHSRAVPPLIVKGGGDPQHPYSILPDEKIVAFNDDDIYVESIEKFAERQGLTKDVVGGVDQVLYPNKRILVPSFTKDFKIELKPVTAIIRHKFNGDMYQVKTRFGRTIKVTSGHSVFKRVSKYKYPFMARCGYDVQPCKVDELKVGDYILVSRKLPVVEKTTELDNDTLWLLGFYLAEGSMGYPGANKNNRTWSVGWSSDQRFIDKAYNILHRMGYTNAKKTPYIPAKEPGGFSTPPGVYVYSKKLVQWMRSLGFEKYPNKKIPEWVYQLPLKKLKYFIQGMYDGDGSHNHKPTTNPREARVFQYGGKEKQLVQGLDLLLKRYGLLCGYGERLTPYGRKEYGIGTSKNLDLNFENWDSDFNSKNRYDSSCHYIGDLALVKVTEIKKLVEKPDWVYDFSVEGTENFMTAMGVMAHNSTAQMQELLDKLKERTAASMIAVKSDVSIEELQGIARNLRLDWWLEYLLRRRYQALGVPPVLMGQPESANRAVGEVVFQDFITRVQLIQVFIGDAIETQLLYPLVKAKFGEEVEKPKIVWKPVVIEDRNMRSQRLVQALQAGAISINEFREEFGFETLDDDKYNDVKGFPTGPMGVPTGMPKVPTYAKPPPEGVPKKEEEAEVLTPDQEFRVKKMRLLVTQEQFKNELLDTIKWTQFELKQGDKTVKDIKKTALEKAKSTIDKYITDTYLYGKLDAVYTNLVKEGQTVKEDVLALTKEDLPAISKLKRKYNKDFKEIVEDMVKDREKGLL